MDRGFVLTDDRLRTNLPGVYAVGDIVPGLQLAHRGFQQGIFIAEDIVGLNPQPIDEAGIPRVTYSHPEAASVSLTEAAAKKQYGQVQTFTYDLAGNSKSQILKTAGAVKLVRTADGPVLGLHLVGDRIDELIDEAQLIYNPTTSPPSYTPTPPRPKPSARPTSPWPANRCTCTADQPADHLRACGRFLTGR